MNHLETSIPGLACMCCGVLLFLFGNHQAETVVAAGAVISAGIGLLRSADASKTQTKPPEEK